VSIQVAPVPRVDPAEPEIFGNGFAQDAVPPSTSMPSFSGSVKLYGSWSAPLPLGGSVHSAWYKAVPQFGIFYAGYPHQSGNQFRIEVETAKAGVISLPMPPEFIPLEAWWLKTVSLPQQEKPLRFRIIAVTVKSDTRGWLGFSTPFVIQSVNQAEICKQLFM
jgi:hypothetical protein